MPANNHKPALQPPPSPRSTAKYTNKDGSKFITVPKSADSESSQPSTPAASQSNDAPDATTQSPPPAVNRKKQKRRLKAAAKAAAEGTLSANGHEHSASPAGGRPSKPPPADDDDLNSDDDDGSEYVPGSEVTNGHAEPSASKSKKSKKKKKKKNGQAGAGADATSPLPSTSTLDTRSAGLPTATSARGPGISRNDKIWSTSNQEERERIKEFWLGLGEDDRKSLVKVEKDAVLRKMKEQQKHTCSCTVCGRKRTAIEEELEGLYDAYYVELESFANNGEGPPMLGPPHHAHHPHPPHPAHNLPPPHHPSMQSHSSYPPQPPSRGRIVEHVGDDEDEEDIEEVYSEDEIEEDDYSDVEPPEEYHNPHDREVADFLTFGNSLQVKGGILTVADDLLKNDGKRFIEMMEQLAERRMAREEDAREHFSRGYAHPNGSYAPSQTHPPPEEEDEYDEDEEDEDDYEESQDDEYDDEEDIMTEEQRMEEGRRMFQIFAARMFEQRVLSAYKEKVAKERQAKLIEELEEEKSKEDQLKARKAKTAQRKKEKAAEKKRALAEEKARKEAERAAEENARREAAEAKLEEQRRKTDEKKREKEAQKKAEEEARLKKEAERQRRAHEQREKQFEMERKAREAKDRERKAKDEQKLREKLAREQKEREALERKEKQERDKREKEARAAKAQREAIEAREAKERAREELASQKAAAAAAAAAGGQSHAQQAAASHPSGKRGLAAAPGQAAAPSSSTVLPQHPPNPSNYASPKVPVATPAIPKAPTPMRNRTISQQQHQFELLQQQQQTSSQPSSSASHEASPGLETRDHYHASPRSMMQPRKTSGSISGSLPLHTQASPSPVAGAPSLHGHSTPVSLPGMQSPPGLAHHSGPPPGFGLRPGPESMMPPGFRPNTMIPPPGINGPVGRGFSPGHMPISPAFGVQTHSDHHQFPIPGFSSMSRDAIGTPHGHSRQGSAGYDATSSTAPGSGTPHMAAAQPIGRPAPIGRPGSTNQGRSSTTQDDETPQLGSRALLGDDEPLMGADMHPPATHMFRTQPPGLRQPSFSHGAFGDGGFSLASNPWGPPNPAAAANAFAPPGLGASTWGPPGIGHPLSGPPGHSAHQPFGMGSPPSAFGAMRPTNQPTMGIPAIRSILCQGCRELGSIGQADSEGFIDVGTLKNHLEARNGRQVDHQELLDLFDTEGNSSNGGGSFETKTAAGGVQQVRWLPASADDSVLSQARSVGAPGQVRASPMFGQAAAVRGI